MDLYKKIIVKHRSLLLVVVAHHTLGSTSASDSSFTWLVWCQAQGYQPRHRAPQWINVHAFVEPVCRWAEQNAPWQRPRHFPPNQTSKTQTLEQRTDAPRCTITLHTHPMMVSSLSLPR